MVGPVVQSKLCRAVAGSSKGAVIEVAEAEGDGAAVRHRSSAEGVCEGAAERVQEDSSAHEHHIIQQAHKVRIASKGMIPGTTAWGMAHFRTDLRAYVMRRAWSGVGTPPPSRRRLARTSVRRCGRAVQQAQQQCQPRAGQAQTGSAGG
jgi:hypothetical protein